MNIHIHYHDDRETKELLHLIIKKLHTMGQELDSLTNEVSETKGIMLSAKALIVGFKDALDKAIAAGNPQALTDLSNSLNEGSEDLAAAIAANPLPGEVVTSAE